MKRLAIFLLLVSLFISCEKQQEKEVSSLEPTVAPNLMLFAKEDGSSALNATPAENFRLILKKINPKYLSTGYNPSLSTSELKEIKDQADKLAVAGNEEKTFRNIFSWIYQNIKYDLANNEAYPVFKNRKAVCQGYANLLKIMLKTQNISCLIVNGNLKQAGLNGNDTPFGHAWNYVLVNGKWIVSDPTNNGNFEMENLKSYKHLEPLYVDIIVNEDDNYVFTYREGFLNIQEVKQGKEQLSIPFSTLGIQISAFNPFKEMPQSVKEIYIGKNILSLGESIVGLNNFGMHIRKVLIDSNNTVFEEYKNIIYQKGEKVPFFIPKALNVIELKSIEEVQKNIITNHNAVTEIIFSNETKVIRDYAVENCPKLTTVRVSAFTKIEKNAFSNCGDNLKIVRY